MIDWKKYPKAKYALVSFYDDSDELGTQEVSRPTQTKTVADAVAENGGIHTETMRKWFSLGNMPTLFSYMAVANALGMEVKLTGQSC